MEKKREEILAAIKQQEDSPFSLARKLFREALFQRHPYKFQSMGTTETIGNINRDDLMEFHQKYCIPNNMVLAVFGDINDEEVITNVKDAFAGFEKMEFVSPEIPEEEPLTSVKSVEAEKDIQQVVIQMGFPGMTVRDEDRYAVQMLDAVLSGISYPGGRLHDRLRSNQIVYVVHAYNQPGLDPGFFAIYAGTTPDKMETAMNIIREEIEKIRTELVSDEELERGKQMCISIQQIGLQTNSDQAFSMGLDELYGLGYDNLSHYEERINAITKEDIKRVANKYLTLDKYAIAIVKPQMEAGGE
jgi:zinc protease